MIPVHQPLLMHYETRNVMAAMAAGQISGMGPQIEKFEQQWAGYCGCKYGVAVNSGTAALYAAVDACGVKGREVILPAFTIISCAQAVLAAGGIPVLVDCDPETWCMDLKQVQQKLNARTGAVMPVHMYGHPVDVPLLNDMLALSPWWVHVIEDAAQAHGATVQGQVVGGLGTVGCFSFYSNKIITTGEGGMLVTNEPGIAKRARSYRNLCFNKDRRFLHHSLGHNYRMTNLQAAIGLGQLENLDQRLQIRQRIAEQYDARLAVNLPQLQLPSQKPGVKNVYWMYAVVVDEEWGTAADLAEALWKGYEIETRPFFVGMHEQPVFQRMGLFKDESYPVTERIARQGLYLPSGFNLTERDIEFVSESCRAVLSRPLARTQPATSPESLHTRTGYSPRVEAGPVLSTP